MTQHRWVQVASYGMSFEADIAVARLEAAGILAIARGNDLVGLFGPGYSGATSRGIHVLVPSDAADVAIEVLGSLVD